MKSNFNTFALSKKFVLSAQVFNNDEKLSFNDALATFGAENVSVPMLIQYTLMEYGKSLTDKAFLSLCMNAPEFNKVLALDIEEYLKDLYGNNGSFDTLFGNFPNTVLGMSEFEMAMHTIMQYFTDGAYFPKDYSFNKNDSENYTVDWNLCVKDKYEMIDVIDYTGLGNLYKTIITAQQSLTPKDKEAILYIKDAMQLKNGEGCPSETYEIIQNIEDIPFKETLCLVVDVLGYKPKTITDVLRYAVYKSGGDIALPSLPKVITDGWSHRKATKADYKEQGFNFKKFTRSERKMILNLIENVINNSKVEFVAGDMKKYLSRWLRLGEIVHPSEYKSKYPKAAKAFDIIRNNVKSLKSWGGKVDLARQNFDFKSLMHLYAQRPGEFARALDSVIRLFGEDENILAEFEKNISKIPMKMLLEVSEHFAHRKKSLPRYVTPKGSKTPVELSTLKPLSENYVNKILTMFIKEIVNKQSVKANLTGKTFVLSKDLVAINLPKNMREASEANLQLAKGTKVPLPEGKDLIRAYCHWIDPHGNEDLDLSAQFIDRFGKTTQVGWNTGYRQGGWCQFSGDVRHHQGNCAEYIDISISKAIEAGMKYAVLTVNDYDGHNFRCDSYAGFMARDQWGTPNETSWAPSTVANEFKINSKCHGIVMAIIDLENRKFIIVDEDIQGIPVASTYGNNNWIKFVDRFCAADNANFWNAYSLITTVKAAQGANIMTLESDEEIALSKEVFADEKSKLDAKVKKLDTTLATLSKNPDENAGRILEVANQKTTLLNNFNEMHPNWQNTEYISYSDIAKDYVCLLDYMS